MNFLLHAEFSALLFMGVCVAVTTNPYKNVFKEKKLSLSHSSSAGSSLRSDRCIALCLVGMCAKNRKSLWDS